MRTGDVVIFKSESENQESPNLYLVITPACDLARFWKKTRGTLTVAKMHPLISGKGLARIQSYGSSKFQIGASITATNPMVMPSVPISSIKRVDYALFAHEIESKSFENLSLRDAGNKKQLAQALTYEELEGAVTRKCRVSEPFLSGILDELASILFRLGIPDYPEEELSRLKGTFNA